MEVANRSRSPGKRLFLPTASIVGILVAGSIRYHLLGNGALRILTRTST